MNTVIENSTTITPSKVVCIGRNYVAHIKELNNEMPSQAVIFVKPNSALANEIYSQEKQSIHYESELSFIIKSGKISSVGFGLDLTKREVQSQLKQQGLPWERAKAFDKSAVFSEFVSFHSEIKQLSLRLIINDKLRQQASFDLMIYKPFPSLKYHHQQSS